MKRTPAIATAAAITGTIFAAGAAAALNTAILTTDSVSSSGLSPVLATADPVSASGQSDLAEPMPSTTAPAPAPTSPATVATLPTIRSVGAEPVARSSASGVAADGSPTYSGDREDDEHENEHEYENEQYEGSDSDD